MEKFARDVNDVLNVIQRGEADALDALLADFRAYVKLFAQAQLNLRQQPQLDASDVAQDALLEAYQQFDSFRGQSMPELKAWLRQIVARKVIDRIRYEHADKRDARRRIHLSGMSSGAVTQARRGAPSTPSARAARHEQSLLIVSALDRLPRDHRNVIILRQFNQLSFGEIGRRLNRTAGAGRMLFARAIDRLRRELQGMTDER